MANALFILQSFVIVYRVCSVSRESLVCRDYTVIIPFLDDVENKSDDGVLLPDGLYVGQVSTLC